MESDERGKDAIYRDCVTQTSGHLIMGKQVIMAAVNISG
jgi:hypothetical protein